MKSYVGMGSNLGDRAGHLLLAVRGLLDAGLRVARLSSIYETAPVGHIDQPYFLNMVAELSTENCGFTPEQLLARLLRIEYTLGRRGRGDATRGGPRTVDLDLLFYGDERRETEFLILPHPRLHLRRFVLAPLAEIAPDTVHPQLKQTFRELLSAVEDEAEVRLWRASPGHVEPLGDESG